jgi:thiol-disulfide isomerase/thioredoxin
MTVRISFPSCFPLARTCLLILARNLFLVTLPLWLFAAQTQTKEFERELEAGKQAAGQGHYAEALGHLTKANNLHEDKCSECFVWLARIDMADGNLRPALEHTEKAIATAGTDLQRSSGQLYRGIVLSRQGNFSEADRAFKAASAANSACVECRFNLGFILLKEAKDGEGVAVLKTVAPEFAGTRRGREIQRFIADPSRIRKDYAPEFSATTRSGEEINLDTLKGKVVLLDFWGTWCAPCRVSLPLLKDLAAKVDPAKVAIISIDEGDSKENWERFVQENSMNWFQVYDGDRSLYRAFGVDGYPRYFVLSEDGIILEEFKGWNQNGEATISEAIARAQAVTDNLKEGEPVSSTQR